MKNKTARREIESLDYYLQNHTDDYSEESHTAMMMAVKVLDQEPCEDAISRQAAIDAIHRVGMCKCSTDEIQVADECSRAVGGLPPVNPQPKTGHWILTSDDDLEYCTCSECGYQNGENWMIGSQIKFCQECGAKMQESEE